LSRTSNVCGCRTSQSANKEHTNMYKETVCHFIYVIVKSLIIVEPEDSCAVPNNALHPLPVMKQRNTKGSKD
jgi:hypothetical protein